MHRAVILSAGQGSRLHPLTLEKPKCLIEIAGLSILERQLNSLEHAGVTDIVIVTGYKEQMILETIGRRADGPASIRTVYNPFYAVAENISSVWVAKDELAGGSLLLNGDTIVSSEMVEHLLHQAHHPITLCSDIKNSYDDDDMKMLLCGERVVAISKALIPAETGAESVGLCALSPLGATRFLQEVEQAIRMDNGLRQYYLVAIQNAAQGGIVGHLPICGYEWCEVDYFGDIITAEAMISGFHRQLIA